MTFHVNLKADIARELYRHYGDALPDQTGSIFSHVSCSAEALKSR
jgi:hypothetical protein